MGRVIVGPAHGAGEEVSVWQIQVIGFRYYSPAFEKALDRRGSECSRLCRIMASIVDELAQQALDDSVPLDSLLRRVRALATLLDLDELSGWADKELNGYDPKDEVPPYRMMSGEVKG
jgi:AbiTii